jgi:hypothetical protein
MLSSTPSRKWPWKWIAVAAAGALIATIIGVYQMPAVHRGCIVDGMEVNGAFHSLFTSCGRFGVDMSEVDYVTYERATRTRLPITLTTRGWGFGIPPVRIIVSIDGELAR